MAQPLAPLWEGFRRRGVDLAAPTRGTLVPWSFGDTATEHLATRRRCGLFDFSFMGCFEFTGANARLAVEQLQTRSLATLSPGRLAYTLLLRADGTVLIDATLWCLASDRWWLFIGRRADLPCIAASAGAALVRDLSGAQAVLALQGPASARVLERQLGAPLRLGYFAFRQATLAGTSALIGRLGYSGELGYELVLAAEAAPVLWQQLAADSEVRECGFAAADSLRIESGFILFTAELARPVSPFALGLERLVSLPGRSFVGADPLRAPGRREPETRLVGLAPMAEPGRSRSSAWSLPRAEVTSRARSPIFGCELALGFAPGDAVAPGTLVAISDAERARVCRLPFYDPGRALPRRDPVSDRRASPA
jgi:aminomethyltransferase